MLLKKVSFRVSVFLYLKTPHPLSNHFDIFILYKVAKTIVQGINGLCIRDISMDFIVSLFLVGERKRSLAVI